MSCNQPGLQGEFEASLDYRQNNREDTFSSSLKNIKAKTLPVLHKMGGVFHGPVFLPGLCLSWSLLQVEEETGC